MKTINLICKVETESTLKNVIEKLSDYIAKKSEYDFSVNICCSFDNYSDINLIPENFEIYSCEENQGIEQLVNEVICSSMQDCVICTALNDNNWEHKLNKLIENMASGVDVCRISKLFQPKNFIFIVINLFIKLYYSFINFFTETNRNINVTDINFQAFSQRAVFIMKNQKSKMFSFRYTDGFILLNDKILFLKNENNSESIQHLKKQKITKMQIVSLSVLGFGILFVLLSFPLLLKVYIEKSSVLKFVILDILIFFICAMFSFYYYFSEEIKRYEF